MNQPLDYERPDWTAEEMRQDPPFHYGRTEALIQRVERMERRTERMLVVLAVALPLALFLGMVL